VPGDLILFGAGVKHGPQQSAALWQRRTLPEAHLARVESTPYTARTRFWPDEPAGRRPKYNPSIDITYLGSLAELSLRPGSNLDLKVIEALRSSGIRREAVLTTTVGSRALAAGAFVLARPPAQTRPGGRQSGRRHGAPRGGGPARSVSFAPLPRRAKDISVVLSPPATRTIERREQKLVDAYRKHMEAKGHSIVRLKIVDRSGRVFWNDIYDKNLKALIEAKGSSDRESIRMALGQVLDYERGAAVSIRGVLVPKKPDDDLIELLEVNGVIAIWAAVSGFADSGLGSLV
jgi:hypothetical protein